MSGRGWCPTQAPVSSNKTFFYSKSRFFLGKLYGLSVSHCKAFNATKFSIAVVEGQEGVIGEWKTNLPALGFGIDKNQYCNNGISNGRIVDVKVKGKNSISPEGEEDTRATR